MQPTDVLAGRYRLDRLLGQTRTCLVFRATHLQLGEPLIVKALRPDAAADAAIRQRFMTDAQELAKLKNEHVPLVLDVGFASGGEPFLVASFSSWGL